MKATAPEGICCKYMKINFTQDLFQLGLEAQHILAGELKKISRASKADSPEVRERNVCKNISKPYCRNEHGTEEEKFETRPMQH